LNDANAIQHQGYQPYQYQRIADINPDQQSAMNSIRQFTDQGGTPEAMAANRQLYDTSNGSYLNANPYASASNPYSGFGSQFNTVLNNGLEDIRNQYQQGTAADTTRMFNMAGAFGGSAHQNAMANNESALAKQMGNYTAGMQNDQFNRSAGLQESALNRGSGAFEDERNRMMGAVPGAQNTQNMFLQGANARMGVGDINRSYDQDQLNQYYNDWQAQQNYPQSQLDYYTGILSRAQGGMSPNSTTTQSGYAASPYSQVLGAGLAAYGLMK
jgi:hypothetical protein